MHILVTNDDGPPSNQSSPYVHSLVSTLQAAGHTVSVVLPHTQRSWIGKAHLVGKSIKPTYFRPEPLRTDEQGRIVNAGTTHNRPLPEDSTQEEWLLVDSTPASCVQIGLNHYFATTRGEIDLVISGPNYGRNSTAVFSLSSGTIGGAMEAAVCGVRAIALSYAFFDRNHDAGIITGASKLAVKLIEHLYANWDANTHLYSVNVPLVENVGNNKILYTDMLQNKWRSSCFEVIEVPSDECLDPDEVEANMRKAEEKEGRRELAGHGEIPGSGADTPSGKPHIRYPHKHFLWKPKFEDVYRSVEESEPGNDGWAVAHGYTSVTPLRANFMHVGGYSGNEIMLE